MFYYEAVVQYCSHHAMRSTLFTLSAVGWVCRIHRLYLFRRVRSLSQRVSYIYITKSDGEAPFLEIEEMWSIPSLKLVQCLLWLGVVAPDKVLSMGQIEQSSSSSYHAASMDLPDPLSPPVSIVHRSREIFKAISCIGTVLLYIGSSWSPCLCSSLWRDPPKYIAYESVLTSPTVSCMSGSSNFGSFHDGWWVAVQLLFCGVLPPEVVQYCSQNSCFIVVKFFINKMCLQIIYIYIYIYIYIIYV